MTRDELELLDILLDERLPPGQRTACVQLEELGHPDLENTDRLLHRLAMQGLIDYVPPIEEDGYAIITRRRPSVDGMLARVKKRKPRTVLERALHNHAPRGA